MVGDELRVEVNADDGTNVKSWHGHLEPGSRSSVRFPELPPALASYEIDQDSLQVVNLEHLDHEGVDLFEDAVAKGLPRMDPLRSFETASSGYLAP